MFKEIFRKARRYLAKAWLNLNPGITVIGVTGSYGKTNTVRAITTVLAEKYRSLQTDLNLDTIYNLPITILRLRPWHQMLVLEYGVDKPGEMDLHLSLVKPKIGILTGITPVHADKEHLGSLENILKEKMKLLKAIPKDGFVIINWDDRIIRKAGIKTKAKIFKYGVSQDCDFWAEKINVDLSGTSFMVHHKNEEIPIKISLLGKHFVHSVLASFAVGKIFGLNTNQIVAGLKKLKPLDGRMSLKKGPLGTVFLDDHLRANLASVLAGLETFSAISWRGRKIAVLGEMGEMGRYGKSGHQNVGQKIAKLKIDFLVAIGPFQKETARAAIKNGMKKENVFWVKDVKEGASVLKKILKRGDFIYLKGSLLRHLERIPLILGGKKVKCVLVSCHHYGQCQFCPSLK